MSLNEPDAPHDGVQSRPNWLRETPFWAVSAALHLVLILIIMTIPLFTNESERPIQHPPPEIRLVAPQDDNQEPERAIKKSLRILDPKQIKRPLRPIRVQEVTTEIPRGVEEKKLSNVLDADSFSAAIGAGPGRGGPYGNRLGTGKAEALDGDGVVTEPAVRAALEWLRRHQNADGSWSSRDYVQRCRKTCRNLDGSHGEGRGFAEHDVGVTGLAMLAFTGYGQTHRDGDQPEFVRCLRLATDYLRSVQVRSKDPLTDGRFGPGDHEQWIYDHAIATMAMSELLGMSRDVIALKRPVEAAVKLLLRSRNSGSGWRYNAHDGANDTSVTGWVVLALKAAKGARLSIPDSEYRDAFRGALTWFDRATSVNGKTGYMAPGDPGSMLSDVSSDPYPYSKELSCMTAVSVLCRIFGGTPRGDRSIRRGVDILLRETPAWQEQKGRNLSRINQYYWYYASYALHQFGGKSWKTWNEPLKTTLLRSQRKGNIDEDGSWDPIGEWGLAGGRVYSTAIGAMTLEVYYRYIRHRDGLKT